MKNLRTLHLILLLPIISVISQNCKTKNNIANTYDFDLLKNKELTEEFKKTEPEEFETMLKSAQEYINNIGITPFNYANSHTSDYKRILDRIERMTNLKDKENCKNRIKDLQKTYVETELSFCEKTARKILARQKSKKDKISIKKINELISYARELKDSITIESDIVDNLKEIKSEICSLGMQEYVRLTSNYEEKIKELTTIQPKEKFTEDLQKDIESLSLAAIIEMEYLLEQSEKLASEDTLNSLQDGVEKIKTNLKSATIFFVKWNYDNSSQNTKPKPSPVHYESLGLKNNATQEEIKKAFRTLSKKYHPDKGGDKEHFIKISDAYQALINDKSYL